MAAERKGPSRRSVAVVGAATVVAALLVGLGFWVGRRTLLARFDQRIREFETSETLGQIAGAEREGMARCFDDPARAAAEMDRYSWAVPNIPTPFVGIGPEPGQHGNAWIDDNQFRHAAPIASPKPAGTFRIFFTGGSTAYGTGAPGDDATIEAFFARRLEQELAPRTGRTYEVINAANGAWASTHERILIENRLSEMQPDLVISLSGNNELHWGYIGMNVLWFRNYAESHFGFLVREVYQATGRTIALPKSPNVGEPVPIDDVVRRLEKNLRLATCALEPTGAPYVFALQPTLAATRKPLTEREQKHRAAEILQNSAPRKNPIKSSEYFARGYERYRAELSKLELPGFQFLDLSVVFDDLPEGVDVFVDSYHFGDRGNEMIADRLYEELLPLLERP
jgi:hypothetical protein